MHNVHNQGAIADPRMHAWCNVVFWSIMEPLRTLEMGSKYPKIRGFRTSRNMSI